MAQQKKLLVTGASGFLGWNLVTLARLDWNVYGIYNRHREHINNVTMVSLDLTDHSRLKTLFNDIKPDAVIHTAAISNPNYCETHRMESRKVNVDVSLSVAALCASRSVPLVFTSTDLVFDGTNPPYTESSEVNPVNIYSEHKVAAEEKMRSVYPETTVCRMPLMFGHSGSVNKGFTAEMIAALMEGRPLTLFSDEYRTPVDAQSASAGVLLFISKSGDVFHLGGQTRISRYGMGLLTAELLSLGADRIKSIKQKDMPMPAKRPADVSLDSSKAMSSGYSPMGLNRALKVAVEAMGGTKENQKK